MSATATRVRHDLHVRRAEVSVVEDLGPRLRRLTLALAADAAAVPFVPLAVGDHVKLALPHPVTGDLVLPRPGTDAEPGAPRPVLRDYTVRAVPDERHVVVDVVLHGEGAASTWAAAAAPGTPVGVLGPRGSVVMPGDRARYLCLLDESALPVAARWLEEAPAGALVDVAVEVEDPATAAVPLPARGDARVTWVAGTDGAGLARHLADLRPGPDDLVWAAGEAGSMLAVRRAAKDLGVAPDALEVHGYWRHGVAGRDHHAPLES
ncbi:siderophore-interacting protein [Phycicoccus sp. BSK3Z-2]|uniref:Siderophore-interacting protein n=1 Tax=Phycicoccus avicenniae TaxID=2828860 RepID=A0A941I268_9MICO|nr:siderophore-interacting protein [Phycicoccus avicenniae]MBR7744724.1 siderophore-interacting protein [Phycicoccus avicenniae]